MSLDHSVHGVGKLKHEMSFLPVPCVQPRRRTFVMCARVDFDIDDKILTSGGQLEYPGRCRHAQPCWSGCCTRGTLQSRRWRRSLPIRDVGPGGLRGDQCAMDGVLERIWKSKALAPMIRVRSKGLG